MVIASCAFFPVRHTTHQCSVRCEGAGRILSAAGTAQGAPPQILRRRLYSQKRVAPQKGKGSETTNPGSILWLFDLFQITYLRFAKMNKDQYNKCPRIQHSI